MASKTLKQLLPALLFFSISVQSQDYPYEDAPKTTLKPSEELPVESPEELEKTGRFQKRTSLFRMAVKGGGNHTYIQSEVADLSGFGPEGRLAFGWDLAFQPVYIETEVGYRGLNLSTDFPVNVIVIQQGLYYRERIGKTNLWKPGIVSGLDVRIETIDATTKETTIVPSLGITSLWEINPLLFQITGYVHRIGSGRNFLSSSLLIGLKF